MKLAPKAPPAGREEGLVETDLSDSGARSSCSEERLFFTTPPRRDFTETISIFDQSWIRELLFSIYQNWMQQRIGQKRSYSLLETRNGFKDLKSTKKRRWTKKKLPQSENWKFSAKRRLQKIAWQVTLCQRAYWPAAWSASFWIYCLSKIGLSDFTNLPSLTRGRYL